MKRLIASLVLTTAMAVASLPALAFEVRPISPIPTLPPGDVDQPALLSPKPVCCFVVR